MSRYALPLTSRRGQGPNAGGLPGSDEPKTSKPSTSWLGSLFAGFSSRQPPLRGAVVFGGAGPQRGRGPSGGPQRKVDWLSVIATLLFLTAVMVGSWRFIQIRQRRIAAAQKGLGIAGSGPGLIPNIKGGAEAERTTQPGVAEPKPEGETAAQLATAGASDATSSTEAEAKAEAGGGSKRGWLGWLGFGGKKGAKVEGEPGAVGGAAGAEGGPGAEASGGESGETVGTKATEEAGVGGAAAVAAADGAPGEGGGPGAGKEVKADGAKAEVAAGGGTEGLPERVDVAIAMKKNPLDPKVGTVEVRPIIQAEGGTEAAAAVLEMEKGVFSQPPFVYKEQEEPGYLYGWVIPELAHRIARRDCSRHLPECAMGSATRVGGVMRRLGVLHVASGEHTVAVTVDGKAYSWGPDWDSAGKPGGVLGRPGPYWRPAPVEGIDEAVSAVAVGRLHSVAVTVSGKVYTWGRNNRGQLGRDTPNPEDGSKVGRVTEGGVEGEKIIQVSAGPFYTLAVAESGKMWVWGACYFKGDAPWEAVADVDAIADDKKAAWAAAAREAAKPRQVTEGPMGTSETQEASAGIDHWVVLARNGNVFTAVTGFTAEGVRPTAVPTYEWLGHEGLPTPDVPGQVKGMLSDSTTTAIAVAAGRRVTFALLSIYKVVSWGAEEAPSLGRPSSRMDARYPAFVGDPEGGSNSMYTHMITQISASEDFALARSGEGVVFSWGGNRYGQLGRPGLLVESEPGLVVGLTRLEGMTVAAGYHQGFAITVPRGVGNMRPEILMLEEPKEDWGGGQSELSDEDMTKAWGAGLPAEIGEAPPAFPVIWEESHKAEIVELTKDMVPLLPAAGFERKYRNPCWHDSEGKFHCLPFFFIIGVNRAATQDLYHRLTQSDLPEIVPSTERSPQWWDLKEGESFQWYMNLFNDASTKIEKSVDTITGEASSTLLTYSGVMARGGTSRGFMLPELLFAFLPTAQMIVLLRNPVDRVFSEFFASPDISPNNTPQDFAVYVGNVLPQIESCIEEEGPYKCARKHYKDMPIIAKSMYAYFVQDWVKVFDRNLFLFLKFEDYIAKPKRVVTKVLKFLDLDTELSEEQWSRVLEHPIQEQRPKGMNAQMDRATRRRLEKFFAPMNQQLMHLVGDKKYTWTELEFSSQT